MSLTAGVVGVQGDVSEHVAAFEDLADALDTTITVEAVRTDGIIPSCDVVSIPGGESTTIGRLIQDHGLAPELRAHVDADKPLLATCAGLIVISADPADERVNALGLLDVAIERNAFGRQRDSFEAPVPIRGFDAPFPGVFIRAPVISDPRETEVLARVDGRIVAVRSGSVLGTAFHPELTGDSRIHRLAVAQWQ